MQQPRLSSPSPRQRRTIMLGGCLTLLFILVVLWAGSSLEHVNVMMATTNRETPAATTASSSTLTAGATASTNNNKDTESSSDTTTQHDSDAELAIQEYKNRVDTICSAVSVVGQLGKDTTTLIPFLLKRGAFTVDVGARAGASAIALLRAGAGKVVSLEAHPEICSSYLRNLKTVQHRADLICAAVGSRHGVVRFQERNVSTAYLKVNAEVGSAQSTGRYRTVPVVTLETVLDLYNMPEIDLLVTNTQGYEEEVLVGAGNRLREVKEIILDFSLVLLSKAKTIPAHFIYWIHDQGFHCFYLDFKTLQDVAVVDTDTSSSSSWSNRLDKECVHVPAFIEALSGGWTELWCTRRADL